MRGLALAEHQPVAMAARRQARLEQRAQAGQAGAVADQDHRPVVVGRVEIAVGPQPEIDLVAQPRHVGQPAAAQAQVAIGPAHLAHQQLQRAVGGQRGDRVFAVRQQFPAAFAARADLGDVAGLPGGRGAGRWRQRQQVAGAALAVRVESFALAGARVRRPAFPSRAGRRGRPAGPDDAASGAARRRRRCPRRRGRTAAARPVRAAIHPARGRSRRTARIRCRPAPARRSAGPKVAAPRGGPSASGWRRRRRRRADRLRRRCWPRTARVRSRAAAPGRAGPAPRRARPGRRRATSLRSGRPASRRSRSGWRARRARRRAAAAGPAPGGPAFRARSRRARRQAQAHSSSQHSTTPAVAVRRRVMAFKIARPAPGTPGWRRAGSRRLRAG